MFSCTMTVDCIRASADLTRCTTDNGDIWRFLDRPAVMYLVVSCAHVTVVSGRHWSGHMLHYSGLMLPERFLLVVLGKP